MGKLTRALYRHQGYLAFTKARLNSGGIHLKADLNLEPTTAVSCDFMEDTVKKDPESGRYSHRRVAYESTSSEKREKESGNTPTRRRVTHEDLKEDSPSKMMPTPSDDTKMVDLEEEKPNVTVNIAKPSDPFSAFGFMARTALKPAQGQFNSALSHLIESADTSQEILQLERSYMALQKRKKELSS